MSQAPVAPAIAAGGLRLVLFGLPSAGKSALLAALAEAARTQETVLNGKLIDRAQTLSELHKRFGQNNGQPTHEELLAYPVIFEPAAGPGQKTAGSVEADLIDCSGRSAGEMLAKQRSKDGRLPPGPLARTIHKADALIVVADAAAEQAQLQRDFGQLAVFLRLYEQNRSRRTEISGLPVYLVLSKCDLLARKGDTASAWIQRIEERKRQVDQGFQKYFAQQADRDGLAFGKLDLHLWATAVVRPALADRPPNPEPYGVAELFRQCLHSARGFQERREQAAHRLQLTMMGTLGLLAVMVLLGLGVYVSRPSEEVIKLENSLRGDMPPKNASPADRFKEPLEKKLERLKEVQNSKPPKPDFAKLPPARQEEVNQYIQEVETYLKYNHEFLKKVNDPRNARREEDLQKIEKSLDAFHLPPPYAETWKETRFGQRPEQWRKDIQILRKEVVTTISWMEERTKIGQSLAKEGEVMNAKRVLGMPPSAKERDAWLGRIKKYLEQKNPYPPRRRLPGAGTITYETVYHFEPVVQKRRVWDEFIETTLEPIRGRILQEQ